MGTFGDRLRRARKARKLDQKQVGDAVGVSNSAVSAWETDRDVPSFAVLPKLRNILEISLDELICGDQDAAHSAKAFLHILDGDHAMYSRRMAESGGLPADERLQRLLEYWNAATDRKRRALLELLRPEQ